jgi:hypothetical protein
VGKPQHLLKNYLKPHFSHEFFSAFGVQQVGEFGPLKTAASVGFCLAFTRLEPLCQDFISVMLHKDELQRASADEIMVRVPTVPTVPTDFLVIPWMMILWWSPSDEAPAISK